MLNNYWVLLVIKKKLNEENITCSKELDFLPSMGFCCFRKWQFHFPRCSVFNFVVIFGSSLSCPHPDPSKSWRCTFRIHPESNHSLPTWLSLLESKSPLTPAWITVVASWQASHLSPLLPAQDLKRCNYHLFQVKSLLLCLPTPLRVKPKALCIEPLGFFDLFCHSVWLHCLLLLFHTPGCSCLRGLQVSLSTQIF